MCFNNCSGHGRCVDYTCECDAGYDGDDCSFCESWNLFESVAHPHDESRFSCPWGSVRVHQRSHRRTNDILSSTGFIDGGVNILPILTVGDVNVTSSNFRSVLRGAENLLVVATSRSCHRCIHLEMEYQSACSELKEAGVRSCQTMS